MRREAAARAEADRLRSRIEELAEDLTGGRVTIASRWPPACRAALAAAVMLARSRPVSASPRSAGTPEIAGAG